MALLYYADTRINLKILADSSFLTFVGKDFLPLRQDLRVPLMVPYFLTKKSRPPHLPSKELEPPTS